MGKLVEIRYKKELQEGSNWKKYIERIDYIKVVGEFVSYADCSNYLNYYSMGGPMSEFYYVEDNGSAEEVY